MRQQALLLIQKCRLLLREVFNALEACLQGSHGLLPVRIRLFLPTVGDESRAIESEQRDHECAHRAAWVDYARTQDEPVAFTRLKTRVPERRLVVLVIALVFVAAMAAVHEVAGIIAAASRYRPKVVDGEFAPGVALTHAAIFARIVGALPDQ